MPTSGGWHFRRSGLLKKIICVFSLFTSILFMVFGIEVYNLKYTDNILYQDTTSINIVAENINNNEIIDHMLYVQSEYGVYISKSIVRNSNDITIYATDPSLNMKIVLKEGDFPGSNSETYISNNNRMDENQSGQFFYFSKDINVAIFTIDNLTSVGGFSGLFTINTTDPVITKEIISYLNSNMRPSQTLCKPPSWCRIEAPRWRF